MAVGALDGMRHGHRHGWAKTVQITHNTTLCIWSEWPIVRRVVFCGVKYGKTMQESRRTALKHIVQLQTKCAPRA